jgi:signal transduction histidine kinase
LSVRSSPTFLHSVRGRLALLVTGIAAPAVLLTGLMIVQAYRNERAAIMRQQLDTARAIAGVINAQMADAENILTTFAASPGVERDDLAAIDRMARKALAGDERWFVMTDAEGQQLVNTHTVTRDPLPRVRLEPDFLVAMREGRTYVSDLRFGPVAKAMVVHVSRPVLRDGQLKYTLNLAMSPPAVARLLEVHRYAPGSIIAIVDRNAKIIARTRNQEKYVGASAAPDVVSALAVQNEGAIDTRTLENVPVMTTFSRADCGWGVVIGAPYSTLFASARKLLAWALLCSALVTGLALTIALWIGRALLRGIDILTADAETMAAGRPPGAIATGLQETDFVAQAMRRTTETLRRRTRTLEALNRLATGLVAERDVEAIIRRSIVTGRDVSGAQTAAFVFQDAGHGAVYRFAAEDTTPRAAERLEPLPTGFPPAEPQRGVLSPGKSAVDGSGPPTPFDDRIRSYIVVPVKSRSDVTIGALYFGHRDLDAFSRETEDVLTGLAAETAIAIDNAKLYQTLARELDAKSKAEADLRIAQARLSEHAQDLERIVEERTRSLREAIAQMEEFSYTVSHDLRSPLRAMSGYASALAEDYAAQLDATARHYLERIQRASDRMDRLITDLLTYSRVARSDGELERVDVEQMVRETIAHYNELQPSAAKVHVRTPLDPVLAYPTALTQCLANLLTNAAKFVQPGEKPDITVRSERHENRVRIWIEDCGIGIPPEYQGSLFRMFERMPTSTQYEGTGVGLAIVRKAAEKMGGSCGVESDGKTGSRFWIELAAA